MRYYPYLRPLIFCLPPETAHRLAIGALQGRLLFEPRPKYYSELEMNLWGLRFRNPLGVAAGFDKNGVALDGLLAQGFGFVEAGTVTPQPQPGNPQPRLFRLEQDEAVINRLGFNNQGLGAFVKHFTARDKAKGIAGANIGKNKTSSDAEADYVAGLLAVYAHCDYIAVNISSPNTAGLRDLQQGRALDGLLAALAKARGQCLAQQLPYRPVLLKVAPDLDMAQKEDIVRAAVEYGLDGLIISNTTVSRPEHLQSRWAAETGGLSGRPLFALSTQALADFYRLAQGRLTLVGAGGIASAEDAYRKIRAGASLLQLYTALVYNGFGLVRDINDGLVQCLQRDGFSHLREAVGADHR